MQHTILVHAREDGRGGVEFEPESTLWRKPQGHPNGCLEFCKDEHKMKKTDKHSIRFKLVDHTNRNLQFPERAEDAMWVIPAVDANSCPDNGDNCDYSTVEPRRVDISPGSGIRDTLIVHNRNRAKKDWAFKLNFVQLPDPPSGEMSVVQWDPIIRNTNGGAV